MNINKFIFLLLISCCFLQSNCMDRKRKNIGTEYGNNLNKKILIDNNNNITSNIDSPIDELGNTKLIVVCRNSDLEQVKELIECDNANPSITDSMNRTSPLLESIMIRNLEMVEYLIKKGANVNHKFDCITPLIMAVSYVSRGYISPEIIHLLLNYGADCNLAIDNKDGLQQAIWQAIKLDDTSMVRILINAGTNLYDRDLISYTMALQCANCDQIIKILLWNGAKITEKALSKPRFKQLYEVYHSIINKKYREQCNEDTDAITIMNTIQCLPKELIKIIFGYYISSDVQSKRQILVDDMVYRAKNYIEGSIKLSEKISNLISSYYSVEGQDLENYCNE